MTERTVTNVPVVLACDCGNTSIRIGRVVGDDVSQYSRYDSGDTAALSKGLKSIIEDSDDDLHVVVSSVNPDQLNTLKQAVCKISDHPVKVVGQDIPLPMDTQLNQPQSTGTDRLCAAIAAYDRLGQACVVADFGSAITIDCVDDQGVFWGGVIMPGLAMSARALNNNTAALPIVDLAGELSIPGQTTDEAIRSGIILGAKGALRSIVEIYAEKLNTWPLVILTGGDASVICPDVNEDGIVQAVVEDLTIRGVAMAYYNSILE